MSISSKLLERIKKARLWLKSIDKRPSLIWHHDADGLASSIILAKFLQSRGLKPYSYPNDGHGIWISKELIDALEDFAIFADLPMGELQISKKLDKLKGSLIIDHHIPSANLNSKKIVHLNPRFIDPKIYLPTSYLAWLIAKKWEWIAVVGVLGDRGLAQCKVLVDELAKKRPELIKGKDPESIKKSQLGTIKRAVEASNCVRGLEGIKEAFKVIYRSEKPENVLKSRLTRWLNKFEREIQNLMEDFESKSERIANAYIYRAKGKYKVTSVLATRLGEAKPDSIIVILRDNKELHVSARCESGRIDVANLLARAIKGIGTSGGHKHAAGGSVKRRKGLFLQRLHQLLASFSQN